MLQAILLLALLPQMLVRLNAAQAVALLLLECPQMQQLLALPEQPQSRSTTSV
jgi:hypothetical protein